MAQVGTYLVNFRVNSDLEGQLQVALNGTGIDSALFGGSSQKGYIDGTAVITTTAENSVLSIINPTTSTADITIIPAVGGTAPTVSNLLIVKLS